MNKVEQIEEIQKQLEELKNCVHIEQKQFDYIKYKLKPLIENEDTQENLISFTVNEFMELVKDSNSIEDIETAIGMGLEDYVKSVYIFNDQLRVHLDNILAFNKKDCTGNKKMLLELLKDRDADSIKTWLINYISDTMHDHNIVVEDIENSDDKDIFLSECYFNTLM
jgi:hypothetical protein